MGLIFYFFLSCPCDTKKKDFKFKEKVEKYIIYLSPGTVLIRVPSFVSHVMLGVGLPWAKHVICAPVLLLNSTYDGGSWMNDGSCEITFDDRPCSLSNIVASTAS